MPVDIDLICQRAIDTVWGKTAESDPDDADSMLLLDGSTEKTVTLAKLAEYVRSAIESAILDVSDLDDGSDALGDDDYLLVTQGTTGKRIQVSDLYATVYSGLASHVTEQTAASSADSGDVLYVVRGSTAYQVTLSQIASLIGGGVGGSGTADYLAQWVDGDTLKAGYGVVASSDSISDGSDNAVPTTAALVAYVEENGGMTDDQETKLSGIESGATADQTGAEIKTAYEAEDDTNAFTDDEQTKLSGIEEGADVTTAENVEAAGAVMNETDPVVGAVTGIVKADGSGNISAAVADIDYQSVPAEGAFADGDKTKLSGIEESADVTDAENVEAAGALMASALLDEDTMASDDATKPASQQSVKAYVDARVGVLTKTDGTADPTATDDSSEGYSEGSIWTNVTSDTAFICVDSTEDAAVWVNMTESAAGWGGDITDMDISGGTDIGADLADDDLIVVDDGASGTIRKSTISRLWTYISGKLAAAGDAVLAAIEIKDYAETLQTVSVSDGVLTIDYSAGNCAEVTLDQSVTSFVITNPPATGKVGSLTLHLAQDSTGGYTMSWPSGERWAGGARTDPSTDADARDRYVLVTEDGGATWDIMQAGAAFAAIS